LGLAAALAFAICAPLACATQQVKLEMRREVFLRPPTISDLNLDPSGRLDTHGQKQTVKVTMKGDPELNATFDLQGRAQEQAMQEVEPGVYVGSFDVRPDEKGQVDVVGHLVHEPTGARQELRKPDALELFTSDLRLECPRAAAEELEAQLGSLTTHFEFNRFELTSEAKERLTAGKSTLESHSGCIVHLHGYADEIGSEEYNMVLSAERAGEVAGFIEESLGIPAGRLAVHWHGEAQPVDRSGTPEALAKNRRVELHAVAAD